MFCAFIFHVLPVIEHTDDETFPVISSQFISGKYQHLVPFEMPCVIQDIDLSLAEIA